MAVPGAALPVPSCGLELNELEESVMVITAESIWHLGRDKPFTPAELCFNSKALTGLGLRMNTPDSTTTNSKLTTSTDCTIHFVLNIKSPKIHHKFRETIRC